MTVLFSERKKLADQYEQWLKENQQAKDCPFNVISFLAGIGRLKSKKEDWIPVEERLPTKEEYLKDDGRFIVTDGNRTYQSCFDIYSNVFRTIVLRLPFYSYEHDKCVIAWQPLPQTFKKEGGADEGKMVLDED